MRGAAWGRATGLAILLAVVTVAGCSSHEERARKHLEKGSEYLANGQRTEATLEFQSALRFNPRSVEANNHLAEIEVMNGNLTAALPYMQEAYRLDPTNARAALHLASLLRTDQPDRAEALVEGVIEREPQNPEGYIGRSDVALARGRTRDAVHAARKAMEVAPDDPEPDWHYGHVLQAVIREGQVRGEPVEDNVYTEALHGFERYIAKGGTAAWNARVQQARILAAWPTNGREAAAMFRIAVQNALDNGPRPDQLAAAAQAAAYARSVGENDLLEWSLERLVEIEPADLRSWRSLSNLYARTRRDSNEVWQRALEAAPDEPRVHIEYARFLISRWKLDEALSYLEQKADEGIDPPMLLSAIASTQIAAGRLDDARKTVANLERDHPAHPRTILARAQIDLRRGQIARAVQSLRSLNEQSPSPEGYVLLARAEQVSDHPHAALMAINRAIELNPIFDHEEHRMRARLLADRGNCEGAIRGILAIRERLPLSDDDELLLARCRYETGKETFGRKLLEGLLAKRNPSVEAILLFSRKESDDPESAAIARRALERFLRTHPRHWEAIRELTRLDASEGRGKQALARLDALVTGSPDDVPATIRLLRAQLSADQGREEGTLEDALAAFESQPRLRGALELVVALHIRKGDVAAATAVTEEAKRAGALDEGRRLLLGRLYLMSGREADALTVFEKAVASGAEDPALYYQMGLALRSLNRSEEATRAFEKALSISTSFPEANDARRALEGIRSAGAS